MVILGISYFTLVMVLRNRNRMMEDVQGSASVRATRLTTILEGTVSDMEKFLMN